VSNLFQVIGVDHPEKKTLSYTFNDNNDIYFAIDVKGTETSTKSGKRTTYTVTLEKYDLLNKTSVKSSFKSIRNEPQQVYSIYLPDDTYWGDPRLMQQFPNQRVISPMKIEEPYEWTEINTPLFQIYDFVSTTRAREMITEPVALPRNLTPPTVEDLYPSTMFVVHSSTKLWPKIS
jgi:hypothetical protein